MTIAVIRIRGQVTLDHDIKEAMTRLRIRRKYATVVMKDNDENRKILHKIRSFVAFGKISDETLKNLIAKRAQNLPGKKVDKELVFKEAKEGRIESAKPFFRLHPPRGGIETRQHYPKGVLGDNGADISKLIERML
jgi:large subunit ribosomal protein L30